MACARGQKKVVGFLARVEDGANPPFADFSRALHLGSCREPEESRGDGGLHPGLMLPDLARRSVGTADDNAR